MRYLAVSLAIIAIVSMLTACSEPPAPEWKIDPGVEKTLGPPTAIKGCHIRAPAHFSQIPPTTTHNARVSTMWVGGQPPVWYSQSDGEATAITWEDLGQVRVIKGMCPIYPGQTQMVECETNTVPLRLKISVRPTEFSNTTENLASLASHEIDSMRQSVETKNLVRSDVEFGKINGFRFARKHWTADIPVQKRMPSVSMNVSSPAEGFCYASIIDNQVVTITGQAPKGDIWYKTIEQAPLSFIGPGKAPSR